MMEDPNTYRLETFDREPIEIGIFPVRLLKDKSLEGFR
jgi:hypothetical protein